jgi:hypothetical protein
MADKKRHKCPHVSHLLNRTLCLIKFQMVSLILKATIVFTISLTFCVR